MTLDGLKLDFARRTRRGINNIFAGILLWSAFAILGWLLPDSPQKGRSLRRGRRATHPGRAGCQAER